MIQSLSEQETTDVINAYLIDYTNYENDILDLVEILKLKEDKARELVLKRYPQLQVN